MSRDDGATARIRGRSGAEALASMEDIGEILGIDAEPFCCFFYRQPLANDEADGRPVQGGFGPGVVLALHFSMRAPSVKERAWVDLASSVV